MSGRGNDNHMGTNHPREPFPLQIILTLRSPPNPIDVFPTSAAKITLRTVFAANREKNCQRTHSMPTNIPTYRRDPAKATFWLSVQPSMLTLAGTGGRLIQSPSGFPTVYGTTVVSSESGHVTFFQRSGTCVCGEGTFRIFGPKTISAVMLSQWENGAFLFKLIVTAKLFMFLQRYDLAHVQN